MRGSTQNLGPIGSAVLTFIGYKQTKRHPCRQAKNIYIYTRLLERFASIYYFNCGHVLFAYIVKQTKNKQIIRGFSKVEFCYRQIFENSIIHTLPWGHARSQKKFGPDRFSHFDVYWTQTN